MFYVRVPGARFLLGFLLLVAALVVAALKACLLAAACVRVCAFTAAWVVTVPETVSSCSCAGGPLLVRAGGAAGIGGEGGGDGGGALDVRALFDVGLVSRVIVGDRP